MSKTCPHSPAPSIQEALTGVTAERLDAERLLAGVLDCPRATLHAHPEHRLSQAEYTRFRQRLERRLSGEPLAYITGVREFWSLTLRVTPDVLIPRPETEGVVERVLALAPAGRCRVADLGTGSGAIALALAREKPGTGITATDATAQALAVARGNARRLGLEQLRFLCSDWYQALAGERFDIIASNPPYVAATDLNRAQPELGFEPLRALLAGGQGLAALRTVIHGAPRHLADNGWLVLEHGAAQAPAVARLMAEAGFDPIRLHRDLAGLPRVSEGRLKRY